MPTTQISDGTLTISRTYRVDAKTDQILKKLRKEMNMSEAKIIDLMAAHFQNAKIQLIIED